MSDIQMRMNDIAEKARIMIRDERGLILCGNAFGWYAYSSGYWSLLDDSLVDDLFNDCVVRAAEDENIYWSGQSGPLTTTINRYLQQDAPKKGFDAIDGPGPFLACHNGTIDLGAVPFELLNHDPEHYTTRKIDCEYDPKAKCDHWIGALERAFHSAERTEEDVQEMVAFLQEWFGINLIGARLKKKANRGLRHGLILEGPSGTAKSTVADVFEFLIGEDRVAAHNLNDLSTNFGKQGLIGKDALISNEAANTKRVDSSIMKTLITGDPIYVDRKGIKGVRFEYHGAVLFTTNSLPRIDDEGGGVYSRYVILPMQHVFTGKDRKRDFRNMTPLDYWKKTNEFPGILNWSLEGFARAYDRTHFNIPKCVIAEANKFRRQNDPSFSVISDHVTRSKKHGLDFLALANMVKFLAETSYGTKVSVMNARAALDKTIRELHTDAILTESTGERATWEGLTLTDEGKKYWGLVRSSDGLIPSCKDLKSPVVKLI